MPKDTVLGAYQSLQVSPSAMDGRTPRRERQGAHPFSLGHRLHLPWCSPVLYACLRLLVLPQLLQPEYMDMIADPELAADMQLTGSQVRAHAE